MGKKLHKFIGKLRRTIQFKKEKRSRKIYQNIEDNHFVTPYLLIFVSSNNILLHTYLMTLVNLIKYFN